MAPIPGISCMGAAGAGGGNIQFVGAVAGSAVSAASLNVSLSGTLTGGVGSSPIVGDVVVVCAAQYSSGDINMNVTGYTELCDLFSNDTVDANLIVSYKRMISTPDTSFTVTSTTNFEMAVVAHVWRNVNATTPIDVTTTTATGTNSALANPPSITPVTGGAIILAVGAAATTNDNSFTNSQLSNFREESRYTSGGNRGALVGVGSYAWAGGAFNPNAFSLSAFDSVVFSWAAATLALRP